MGEIVIEAKQGIEGGYPFALERIGITWDSKWGKRVSFIADITWPGADEEYKAIKAMLQKWVAAEEMFEALFILKSGVDGSDPEVTQSEIKEAVKLAEAALAKARGES